MATLVSPNVWVGDASFASDDGFLERNKIRHVLSVGACEVSTPISDHVSIHIKDESSENILEALRKCVEYIEKNVAKGEATYVHCRYGRNRSVAVVVAYLSKASRKPIEEMYRQIRDERCQAFIVPSFLEQLRMWQEELSPWKYGNKTTRTNSSFPLVVDIPPMRLPPSVLKKLRSGRQ